MGKEIRLQNIKKSYKDNTVLEDISLQIEAGERVVLLGPSGSGKSTLLRMIAGLESISSGELYLGDKLSNDVTCGERDIAMVFQNYALYPHMTVAENVSFALKANKVPDTEIQHRLEEALEILGLSALAHRYPRQLSGGQRQRTALARALVKKSDFFLLDEPLSNLDVRLRLDARKELNNIHQRYGQTFVYVTHDQIEAMTLADRIVILNEGKIQMNATPYEVYHRPANVFTATFIGSPGMNILSAQVCPHKASLLGQDLPLTSSWLAYLQAYDSDVLLGIRPEHVTISKEEADLIGRVRYCELLGQSFAMTVDIGGQEMIVLHHTDLPLGSEVHLSLDKQNIHFFHATSQHNLGYPTN